MGMAGNILNPFDQVYYKLFPYSSRLNGYFAEADFIVHILFAIEIDMCRPLAESGAAGYRFIT